MIIVASSGYAFKDNEYPVFFPGDFDSELVNSIIPYIEENFKVKKGRNNRAVAGLSLGSGQATDIAARHPELFFSSWCIFRCCNTSHEKNHRQPISV